MFGMGDGKKVDENKLPLTLHAVKSKEAFGLAEKIWQENVQHVRADAANRKEILHFSFAKPPCVVWLQRDQGRIDTYELILVWEGDTTEAYVVSGEAQAGDDTRCKSLLNAVLTTPSTVPAEGQNT